MKVLLGVALAYYALLTLGTQWLLHQDAGPQPAHRVEGRRLPGNHR